MESRRNKAVIYLHGFTGNIHESDDLKSYLKDSDYDFIQIHLAGHEEYNTSEINKLLLEDFISDAAEKVRNYSEIYSEINLIGNSFGANLACSIALTNHSFKSLVLLSPYAKITLKWRIYFALLGSWLPKVKPSVKKYQPKEVDISKQSISELPLKALMEVEKSRKNLLQVLKNITVPALIIGNNNDFVLEKDNADYVYRNIETSNKEIIKLDFGKEHSIMNDQFVMENIKSFLERN